MEVLIEQCNMYKDIPRDKWYKSYRDGSTYYLYCGRPSPFGNPFRTQGESRKQVIHKFKRYFTNNTMIQQDILNLLKNLPIGITKIKLICFCYPKQCHTDIYKTFMEKYMSKISKLYKPIQYTNIDIGSGIKISPSSLSIYRRNPLEWWDNLNGRSKFKGNKSTVYGTCVHYHIENISISLMENSIETLDDNKLLDITDKYVDKEHGNGIITEDELGAIKLNLHKYYNDIKQFMIDDYKVYEYIEIESSYTKEVKIKNKSLFDKYILAGTIDKLVRHRETKEIYLRDYKTSATTQKSLSKYIIQLEAYKWMIKDFIDKYQVVNIVPLKTKININYIEETTCNEYSTGFKKLLKEIILVTDLAKRQPKLEKYLFRKGVDYIGNINIEEEI